MKPGSSILGVLMGFAAMAMPAWAMAANICQNLEKTLTAEDYRPFRLGNSWRGFKAFESKDMEKADIKKQFKANDVLSQGLDDLTEYHGLTQLFSYGKSPLHVASHFVGSYLCRDDVYFLTGKNGQSHPITAPKIYRSRSHDICSDTANISVSLYGKNPVVIRTDEAEGNRLAILTFAPWQGDRWGTMCQITVTREKNKNIVFNSRVIGDVNEE